MIEGGLSDRLVSLAAKNAAFVPLGSSKTELSCGRLPRRLSHRGRRLMHSTIGWGIAVVVLAAILNGSFAAPIKRMTGWQWENSWLLFAFSGLLVFPWILSFATVPNLRDVFTGASF